MICPDCKEEIDEDSLYCDQCGAALLRCSVCGRVGTGKRCIYCGGVMGEGTVGQTAPSVAVQMPVMTLTIAAQGLAITAQSGAVIGRKKGPYTRIFGADQFVSSLHAQLLYDPANGWGIVDKNSTNGTRVNGEKLAPEHFRALNDGDTLMIADIALQVRISKGQP